MTTNRIMRAARVRRAPALVVPLALAAMLLGGCGGRSEPTTSVPDKEADVEVMDEILGRQLAVVEAYPQALPKLHGFSLAMARKFRAQEQEHVDAMTKALRGLGGEAEPPDETVDVGELKTPSDALHLLYEMESATIDAELSAITKLTGSWPRALLAAMVANQGQHLVLIRRALGAKPLETIPDAFEAGTTAAP